MYIKYIDLLDSNYSEYVSLNEEKKLYLEKMNVFIGKNNSGKSRLMRKVLTSEFDKKYYVSDGALFKELKETIVDLLNYFNESSKNEFKKVYLYNENIREKVYRDERDEEMLALFICNLVYSFRASNLYGLCQTKKIIKSPYSFSKNDSIRYLNDTAELRTKQEHLRIVYESIINTMTIETPKTIFVPSLLSLRKLGAEGNDYHVSLSNMFRNEYFFSPNLSALEIKTGQEVYHDMKKLLLGLNKDRERFLMYEEFVANHFFNGKDISIFIKDDDSNIYIKESNEEPYAIYNLGDGLQTLITITFYLFMNNDSPLKIFIDEPEIHLHPGLQRLLVSQLQEYKNCQIFISTHSSSMIDICDEYDADTAIICVDKNDTQKIAYNSIYDNMNLYQLLGQRASSIILSNCTIWVEGPTDIYYIDSLLNIYRRIKHKKQVILGYNYNYAFNGSINIAYKFDYLNTDDPAVKLNKLSKNNFIIFDSDNLNHENANWKKIKCVMDIMGKRSFVCKNIKTIENIIPPFILRKYYEENFNSRPAAIKRAFLNFFDGLYPSYKTTEYSQLDFVEKMSLCLFEKKLKSDMFEAHKYCKNIWSSNKASLAVYFDNFIKNVSWEEQKEIFINMPAEFRKLIILLSDFIDENNL
ncbi:MAG: ATP-binding protein [Bacilli bacterium]|nr:ATP-binding protein [Bacilli bacterium]